MRITIESTVYDKKKKVVIEEDSDDQSILEVCQMAADALIAYGFAAENVYEIILVHDEDTMD